MFRNVRPGSRSSSSARRHARPRLEDLEGRCLLSGVSSTASYPIPSGTPAWFITKGPDGNLWFTETGTGTGARIGMLNPTTHAISEFPLPNPACNPREIAAGTDGNIWFSEASGSTVGMINPNTHAITEFTLPTAGHVWGLTSGPDGNIWYRQTQTYPFSHIGVIDVTTHAITQYDIPYTYGDNGWAGLTSGPDGNLWFGVGTGVGVFNPTTHGVSLFALPGRTEPNELTAGPDGNIWFTELATGRIGTINLTTDVITEFADPASTSSTGGIASGPDGNIWFGDGHLGRANPSTGAITSFPIPVYRGITVGPDGNLWLTDYNNKTITVATLSPSETDLVVTAQPPATLTAGTPFGLTVAAEDASGNVIPSFNGPVTLSIGNNPTGAPLGGTTTVNALNGVATFSGLTLTKAASGYTLVASSGLSGEGFTSSFTVTPSAATQIVITQQPSSVSVNKAFTLVAAVADQYGNVVTSANNAVSIAIAANPGGGTLGGTTTMMAVNGIVTFSNLTLSKKGTGYTLRLFAAGLAGSTTGAIAVK